MEREDLQLEHPVHDKQHPFAFLIILKLELRFK